MGMALGRALLLSSKHQAEAFEQVQRSNGFFAYISNRYRLVVSSDHSASPDAPLHSNCTLEIFARVVTGKDDKGNDVLAWAKEPHVTINRDLSNLREYLKEYEFPSESGWEPVEEVSA